MSLLVFIHVTWSTVLLIRRRRHILPSFVLFWSTPAQYGTLIYVDLLESVQSRAARFVNSDYRSTSSVTSMLQSLGWKNLEDRWRDVRLALLFKIIHGHQKYDVIHSLEGEQCHSKGLSYLPICRIFWQSSRWPIQSIFENMAHPDDVPTTDIIRGREGHVEISVAPHYYWLVTLWDIENVCSVLYQAFSKRFIGIFYVELQWYKRLLFTFWPLELRPILWTFFTVIQVRWKLHSSLFQVGF